MFSPKDLSSLTSYTDYIMIHAKNDMRAMLILDKNTPEQLSQYVIKAIEEYMDNLPFSILFTLI